MSEDVCMCGHTRAQHARHFAHTDCIDSCGCAGFTTVPRCDFCSHVPATWRLPCRDGGVQPMIVTGEPPTLEHRMGRPHVSMGDWAACDTCKELIDHDRRRALARRAPAMDGIPREIRRQMWPTIERYQLLCFWNARLGDPEPIEPTWRP